MPYAAIFVKIGVFVVLYMGIFFHEPVVLKLPVSVFSTFVVFWMTETLSQAI